MRTQPDTTPFWIHSTSISRFPKLVRDEQGEIVVVGAGITGLTAAYLLASAGKKVIVLERYRVAEVDTAHTSAHLTMVTDMRISELADSFGRDHAQAAWDAGLAAIHRIDSIARAEQIGCDFEWIPGYLHVGPAASPDDVERLKGDASTAASLGFDATFVDEVPLVGVPGVRFDGQARFHPRKYLAGLADAIVAKGGRIFEHSEADEFSDHPRAITVNGRKVTYDQLIIATHNPLVGHDGVTAATLLQTKLALYTTYVVAGKVPKGTVPDALLWDTADPYHYYRIQPQGSSDLVIYGGEDHKTGQSADTAACYDRLETGLKQLLPEVDIAYRWSGQVIETHDGLPYIGEQVAGQFAGTGYSGNGMTFGTLAAMMAYDSIVRTQNPWRDLLALDRTKILGAAWDYVRENKDYPYYLIRDRFAGAEGRSRRSVKRGHGAIIDRGGQRLAVYRDLDGTVTERSAVCTHMGCVVNWNTAERTWDCPCHGSRFTPDGKVISGPAESPLAEPSSS